MNSALDTVIVLCGGDINSSSLPISTSGSNAMIPVNGKPVIGWILDDLEGRQVGKVVLVTLAHNAPLIAYVQWAFQDRLELDIALLQQKGNIVHSLKAGLEQLENAPSVTVLLGDTLIGGDFPDDSHYVLVSEDYDDSRNWCLVETNEAGLVCQYFDKKHIQREGRLALTGLYRFGDVEQLREACALALERDGKELSDVLKIYERRHPIKAIPAIGWRDFGHLPHFFKAKQELLQSRYFNHIRIEPVRGIVYKISPWAEKLRDEHDWYLNLPEPLKVFAPRVLGLETKGNTFTLAMEYYGYPNLAELYLYGHFDLDIWKATIKNLMHTHQCLKEFKGTVSASDAKEIYWSKTSLRLETLITENRFFWDLLALEKIHWNGRQLDNLTLLLKGIQQYCERLAQTLEGTVIHGDFCLSNILYDFNNQVVRLIDPRGRFGQKGIYGDPRYDIAKLRHSLNGGYDAIIADLFTLKKVQHGHFQTELYRSEWQEELAHFFDEEILRAGYLLDDIIFIEALLFLSMIPLHKGNLQRQVMMYLRAIHLFNTMNIKN